MSEPPSLLPFVAPPCDDLLFAWTATDGGCGSGGVTDAPDRAVRHLAEALAALGGPAEGHVRPVRVDRLASHPSYIHGHVLLRARCATGGDLVFEWVLDDVPEDAERPIEPSSRRAARQLAVLRTTYPGWDIHHVIGEPEASRWTAALRRKVTGRMKAAGIEERIEAPAAEALAARLSHQAALMHGRRNVWTC